MPVMPILECSEDDYEVGRGARKAAARHFSLANRRAVREKVAFAGVARRRVPDPTVRW